MGWLRRGKRAYYYRSVRTPDGARHIYFGSGPDAAAAADADRARRDRRAADARAQRERAVQHTAAEAPLDALGQAADVLVRAALLAAGYHCPNRGPWRKRRDRTDQPDAGDHRPGLPAGVAGPDEAGRGG